MDLTFKDILEKYKNKTATDQEIKYIENEIEKNRMINDLLADEIEEDFFEDNRGEIFDLKADTENISKQNDLIKKSINKKLRKIITYSALIVLVVLLGVNYVASPIVDSLYYNPKTISQGEYHEDIYFDMRTFTELSLPGYGLIRAIVDPLSFGEYDGYIAQSNLFTNRPENSTTKIVKGRRIGPYEDLFIRYYNYYNHFGSSRTREEELKIFKEHDYIRKLDELNSIEKTAYTSVFTSFSEDKTLEEFELIRTKYKGKLEFKWVGIRIDDESQINDVRLGFNPNFNDGSNTSDSPSKELYPYLTLIDMVDEPTIVGEGETYESFVAVYDEEHFKSLLKYMRDRPEFTKMLYFRDDMSNYYQAALDYVEENGTQTYGTLAYGTAEDILNFIEEENINDLIIDDVKVSKYSK